MKTLLNLGKILLVKFNNYKVGIHKIIEIDGENFEYDDINILED